MVCIIILISRTDDHRPSPLEAVLAALQVDRCLQALLGEGVLKLDVAEEGVESLLDLQVGGLALRLLLHQTHLDVA